MPSLGASHYDLVVIGSGAGGLTAAIRAKLGGLNVVVLEKAETFGGTTARSGGVLWIPGSTYDPGGEESRRSARQYIAEEAGNHFDGEAVDLFLEQGPKMVDFLERHTEVRFVPTLYPDYHPDRPGGVDVGRSILAAPYDITRLGDRMKDLRPPLETITFMGMMFNSSNADIRHFFNATKSLKSAGYVTRRLASHMVELARRGRATQVTSGNALAARLAKSALDLEIPILCGVSVQRLTTRDGRITGAALEDGREVSASRGVVLATGGFARDRRRTADRYAHKNGIEDHLSPVPAENTGDGLDLAEAVGGALCAPLANPAAWMPVSEVRYADGRTEAFPHLLDRYKPGMIGVLRDGRRFTNESASYHDVGAAMAAAAPADRAPEMWLVCDHRTIRKYGLGHAKPAPVPLAGPLRKGYIQRGRDLKELAEHCGIDPDGLERTVARFNEGARKGEDPEFGRGTTAFNRYLGDPDHRPNPCVAPIDRGPFYALRLTLGELGTFEGLKTSVTGEVLGQDDAPVPGLFAVGNDRASVMGGAYPGAGITLGPIMTFAFVTAEHILQM
ncbi:FAD-dependent oxidoreductase [Pseudooceanicola sp. 216_PA32_1]|uniref:FAD-dependent oxidoreductase n=1 Tax=Pseudooceanicola pacificus TaxID=2676438 RepID=A0A844WBB1_9RHOB|nr:FAD-dependent oxidoreductase [Pseudooceanicola pacificus]MWB78413.1 FAD-dependent oxidoreductase [Pseudooceanicola pacificus]